MKKMITLVLALVFVLGFASAAFAMGPNDDPTNVGWVLVDFALSDQMLSPLSMPNWSGAINSNKAIGEGQPIWFVAHYVNNKIVSGDARNFEFNTQTRKTVFTSKDNTVNFMFSDAYMNFVHISKLSVLGGSVSIPSGSNAKVSAEENKLEVTMVGGGTLTNASVAGLAAYLDKDDAQNYYLQIMAFTKACTEAQGVVYAKTPVDVASFPTATVSAASFTDTLGSANPATLTSNTLNIYNADNTIKYKVVRYTFDADAGVAYFPQTINAGVKAGDTLYYVYDKDGKEIIGFVSSKASYKGLVRWDGASGALATLTSVQWTSDEGGKWAWTDGAAGNKKGEKAISDADLKAVMDFFGFSFGNNYPVLDRHIEAYAGYWMTKEARYNVAAAVITTPDGNTDPVPKTGDVSSSMGLIMIAIAISGLAAVGFVVSKRVHN